MKKFLCILLTLVMIFTLGMYVSADTITGEDDGEIDQSEINGSNQEGEDEEDDKFHTDGGVDDDQFGAGDLFGNPSVAVENVTISQNSAKTVDVVLTENLGFTEMVIEIVGEGFTVTAVENGDFGTAVLEGGKIVIESDKVITENGCVAKVTLTAGDTVDVFNATINVTAKEGNLNAGVTGKAFTVTVEEMTVIPGDIDGSGKVDTTDLAELKLYLAGAKTLEGDALIAADIDGSGKPDTVDLAQMKLYLSGAVSSLV